MSFISLLQLLTKPLSLTHLALAAIFTRKCTKKPTRPRKRKKTSKPKKK